MRKPEYRWTIHLMLDYDGRSSAETTCSAETRSHGTDQHVNLRGRDIVQLGETTAGPSNGPEREGFVKYQTVLVFALEFDLYTVGQGQLGSSSWILY